MGPYVQYATEKPADPLSSHLPGSQWYLYHLRDENDNYNYEKGLSSTITLRWNDKTKTLTIEGRKGSFPGMLKTRTFKVVLVKENHGAGVEPCEKVDKTIVYNGIVNQVKF
jgi:alpha-D-xyloside xylohydrolase